MLGSTTLHGWVESAWYVRIQGSKKGENNIEDQEDVFVDKPSGEPVSIVMEREFRGAGTYPKIEATLRLGAPGDPMYRVDLKKHVGRGSKAATTNARDEMLNLLEISTVPLSKRKLSEELGIGRKALQKILDELVAEEKIETGPKGVMFVREEVKKNADTNAKKQRK